MEVNLSAMDVVTAGGALPKDKLVVLQFKLMKGKFRYMAHNPIQVD